MMDEDQFSMVEVYLFSEWAQSATIGAEEQVMGTWLRRIREGILILPVIGNIAITGTLEL